MGCAVSGEFYIRARHRGGAWRRLGLIFPTEREARWIVERVVSKNPTLEMEVEPGDGTPR